MQNHINKIMLQYMIILIYNIRNKQLVRRLRTEPRPPSSPARSDSDSDKEVRAAAILAVTVACRAALLRQIAARHHVGSKQAAALPRDGVRWHATSRRILPAACRRLPSTAGGAVPGAPRGRGWAALGQPRLSVGSGGGGLAERGRRGRRADARRGHIYTYTYTYVNIFVYIYDM